jgi:glycosyltransferase involved in cell wall biosynthesis
MKLLIFVPDNKSLGGVHIRALAVARNMQSMNKVDICFAVSDDSGSRVFYDEATNQGFSVRIVKGKSRPRNESYYLSKIVSIVSYACTLPVAIYSCLRIIREEKPNIVHVNGLMNIVPIIASKAFGDVRCIHHLIGNHYNKTVLRLYSIISQLSDEHIYISDKLRDYYKKFIPLNGQVLMEPIPRTIVDDSLLRKELCEIQVVGCVANYTPAKNWDLWLDVARLLVRFRPGINFVCIGKEVKGHERYFEHLKKKSSGLSIEWTGFRRNILEEISNFDLFLLTSDYEGTPLVLLEAASVQTPIVTTITGGITDMFSSDEVRFVPEQKAILYNYAILELIDNPNRALEMARKARQRIEADYQLDTHVEKLLTIYNGNFK